jgi:transglutaminase-like putative cysteine protease
MSKIKVLSGFILLASLISCQQYPSEEEIRVNIGAGNFTVAEEQIQLLIRDKSLSDSMKTEWLDQVEIMDRIRNDFSMSEDDVKRSLIRYFPELSDSMLRGWEAYKSLEMRVIDGEKKYFRHADLNLFRLDKEAGRRRTERDGKATDKLSDYYNKYAGTVIEKVKKSGTTTVDDKRFSITFSVSLNPDVVHDGEVVRCWLPFPSVHPLRQAEVKLLETNCDTYQVAPPEAPQRTIYLEKTAIRDSATIFQVSFEVKTAAQWFNVIPEEVLPYNTTSQLFLEYTKERPPHIVFSDEIADLSSQIVGNEKNPVRIVRKIFQCINDSIPWASALEYSTVKCIPGYVLENRHGDCGMQSLLFITLARYNGIPAKWQSGWYMFPVQTNMHDWAEVYYEGIGWVPVDQSFGLIDSEDETIRWFYTQGLDPFRLIINEDFNRELYPPKQFLRSETVDFQRGELEWSGGNLYFDQWDYTIKVTPIVSEYK